MVISRPSTITTKAKGTSGCGWSGLASSAFSRCTPLHTHPRTVQTKQFTDSGLDYGLTLRVVFTKKGRYRKKNVFVNGCLRGGVGGWFVGLVGVLVIRFNMFASSQWRVWWQQFCLLVGCLSSQQHASVSQGRICSDNFTCCHTEIEAADPTFHLTQSQYTDTGPTSPSADPITPGAWQGSHWSANV